MYPVTIVATRYGGGYEGGEWAAFNLDEESLPEGFDDGDIECETWWDFNRNFVGVGNTPNDALADLERKKRDPDWRQPLSMRA